MIFNESYATVFYNSNFLAVEITWKSFVNFEQYKKTLLAALEIINQKKCQRWISDMSKGQAVPNEARIWVQNEFIPMAAKIGIKKAAFLIEENVFRKMYSDAIKNSIVSNGIEIQYFKTRSELDFWIMK